jgi:predicted O-methyltransferase YrrM
VDTQVLAEVRRLTAPEDEPLVAARDRATPATESPSPEVGALLRWAALTCTARSVVEVGSAGGVTGLWLLRGLAERGVLTSIEPDPHTHGLTEQAHEQAGTAERVRSILGDPEAVLPRLSDGAYDLVVFQVVPVRVGALDHAHRLLRPGGMLVSRGVLRPGEHAEEEARFLTALVEDERFDAAVLPLDGGVVLATRRDDPPEEDDLA